VELTHTHTHPHTHHTAHTHTTHTHTTHTQITWLSLKFTFFLFFRQVRVICGKNLLNFVMSVCPSVIVLLSTCIRTSATREIFMKFDISDFSWKFVDKPFLFKSEQNVRYLSWRTVYLHFVDSCTEVNDNTKRKYCCFSMATVFVRTGSQYYIMG
jgi:hypothetical protein